MKKIIALISILAIAFLCVGCFSQTTIKFDINFIVDGEVYATVETDKSNIEMPADPQKDGYEFDGWFWDNGVWEKPLTLNSLMDTPLSETLRVYAKFNQKDDSTEIALKPGRYITSDGISWIILDEGNQYGFNRHIGTSWYPTGKYCVKDNTLVLYLGDEEFAFFSISKDCLIFQSDIPPGLSITNNGTIFMLEKESVTFSVGQIVNQMGLQSYDKITTIIDSAFSCENSNDLLNGFDFWLDYDKSFFIEKALVVCIFNANSTGGILDVKQLTKQGKKLIMETYLLPGKDAALSYWTIVLEVSKTDVIGINEVILKDYETPLLAQQGIFS